MLFFVKWRATLVVANLGPGRRLELLVWEILNPASPEEGASPEDEDPRLVKVTWPKVTWPTTCTGHSSSGDLGNRYLRSPERGRGSYGFYRMRKSDLGHRFPNIGVVRSHVTSKVVL